ncbi:1,4-dihydroxy-6-naphthoate synthase [Paenibacillus shirakamiensis]|uniref:1,4-dihydroxy-6-naphtoate synthase n=1 Tax=Paenibacillus shirakamiensis TaxID=1265935 RepID=A0ABS4JH44_9BACL|nr:1,4-dihydroxy-6-naphthoate synthase [Paenibacillus shirakamiensis]MBP2000365.1 1,4-dihydroxy-6-naphthoate synthase [Paenibacillus shirakamiensis]
MKIAFSPCPNDTFVFHALVHGKISGAPEWDVTYADIHITNHWAIDRVGPDIMKISYAALPWVLEDYALLPCGGALGRGCGPLVLTRDSVLSSNNSSSDLSALSGKRIAVPSERSTAYLLFRLWAARNIPGGVGDIVVMPFDQIMPAVRDGEIDAGLVIHEARFTYSNYNLSKIVDLGSWWETTTGHPIPLGAIIAKRDMDLPALASWIRSSLEYAWAHPEESKVYIAEHAQEMAPEVTQAHIDLYVNSFTADLGTEGYEAISALLEQAAEANLVPKINPDLLKWPY